MSNNVRGVVHLIEETKTFGAKGFRKRLVVLEQDKGSFVNYVPIEVTKDLCDEMDAVSVGDELSVAFRLNGRKWQKDADSEVKYFLAAEALSFEVVGKSATSSDLAERNYQDADAPF